jgi:hypothetical protein
MKSPSSGAWQGRVKAGETLGRPWKELLSVPATWAPFCSALLCVIGTAGSHLAGGCRDVKMAASQAPSCCPCGSRPYRGGRMAIPAGMQGGSWVASVPLARSTGSMCGRG